jgi:hypothetical protein
VDGGIDVKQKLWRLRMGRVLAVAALAVAGGTLTVASQPAYAVGGSGSGGSSGGSGGFRLPADAPRPAAGFKILSAYRVAIGYQVYSCVTAADGTSAWSTPTSTPEAFLRRYRGAGVIHHHAGPRWTSTRDGSTIVGVVDVRLGRDGTIPWLLLHVSAHETSSPGKELDAVTHISRVNTTGGVGPTGACDPVTQPATWVPYGADYVFWVAA